MFGLRKSGARLRARVRPVQARAKRRCGATKRLVREPFTSSRRPPKPGGTRDGQGRGNGRPDQKAGAGSRRAGPAGGGAERQAQGRGRSPETPGGVGTEVPVRRRFKPVGMCRQPMTPAGGRAVGVPTAVALRPPPEGERPLASRERPGRATTIVCRGHRRGRDDHRSAGRLAENFVRELGALLRDHSLDEQQHQGRRRPRHGGRDGRRILIGSRGSTIDALQELTRTAVHRASDEYPTGSTWTSAATGPAAAALQQFAQRLAEEVLTTGELQALEPMSAPDRKVVHDAITDIAGVSTSSEGEDPRRYVVIRPAAGRDADRADPGDGDAAESMAAEDTPSEVTRSDVGDGGPSMEIPSGGRRRRRGPSPRTTTPEQVASRFCCATGAGARRTATGCLRTCRRRQLGRR